jgi:F-type H+-transporting ATPase subunit gamma
MVKRLLRITGFALSGGDGFRHPFLATGAEGPSVVVIVSADKGLCGSFNSHLLKMGEEQYRKQAENGGNPLLVTVGNKAYRYFLKRGIPIHRYYLSLIGHLTYPGALTLCDDLQAMMERDGAKSIEFVFTEFQSASRQRLTVRKVLPVSLEAFGMGESREGEEDEYIFEPDAESTFAALLPRYVRSQIYRTLLESVASEEAARMLAMDMATRNASDMIQSLTLTMNKMRQASITKELLEIITATEAMKQ